jgi:outer membrane protein assembly factor BamD (BamD/ComL family)
MNPRKFTLVVLLLSGVVIASGCSSTAWIRASQSNTQSAYEQFLREHPGSKFAPQASVRIRELEERAEAEKAKADWAQTKNTATISAYREFLQRHPTSQDSYEASQRLTELCAADAW